VVAPERAQRTGATGIGIVAENVAVDDDELVPDVLEVVVVEDGVDGADRLARTTIDALDRVDVHLPIALIDAIDRAFRDARLVLYINARLSHHVSQRSCPHNVESLPNSLP